MNRVVDLTAGDSETAEVLEQTGSGGVLGSTYLHDDPLGAYLAPDEEARWVLRNKKSGVVESAAGVADGADLATMTPDGGHQAFALVTDVRLVFVVGDASGDSVQSLPFADVIAARAESAGLRTNVLRVETQADDVVTFPVTADLDAPAEYVDNAAQVWAHAARMAEEITDTVALADGRIEAGDFEAAEEAVAGVEADLEAALGELGELGQGALTEFIPVAEDLVDDVSDVRRRAQAGRGAAAHARAQAAWDAREYGQAAGAYADALGGYDAAVHNPGDRPREDAIRRRVLGAAREREVLRVAPLIDLLAAKERAARVEDPTAAAEEWERALELARGFTGLEWPTSGDGFRLDSRSLREHAAECAETAIDHRETAGRRWMAAGDRVAGGTLTDEARQAYERARIHIERARSLSRELLPDRLDALEETMAGLEARLAGEDIPGPGEGLDLPMPSESLEDIAPGAATEPSDEVAVDEIPTAADAGGGAGSAPEDETPETMPDPEPIDTPFQTPPVQPNSRETWSEPAADETTEQRAGVTPVDEVETAEKPDEAEAATEPAEGEPSEEPAEAEPSEEPAEAEPATEPEEVEPATEPDEVEAGAEQTAAEELGGPPELDDFIGPADSEQDDAEAESEGQAGPPPTGEIPEPMDAHSGGEPHAATTDDAERAGDPTDVGQPAAETTDDAEPDPEEPGAGQESPESIAPAADADTGTESAESGEPAATDTPVESGEPTNAGAEEVATSQGWEFGRSALTSATEAAGSEPGAGGDESAEPSGEDDAEIVDAEAVEAEAGSGAEDDEERTIRRRIRALDADAFADLVADLWEAEGWSTMSFAASGGSVYDTVAIRDEPEAERLLLWTDHRPDSGIVPERVVERIAATRDRSEGADRLALVSSGRLTSKARDRADRADIDVTDGEALAAAVREAGLDEDLPEAT